MSVNKVILIGNLGADPEMRYTPQQVAIANLRIATTERRKDASGNWTDHTEWHRVTVFGKQAENCGKYLKKGRTVYIEGRLQTRKWQDKEGKDRYSTDIVADTVKFIGGGRGANDGARSNDAANMPVESFSTSEEMAAGRDLVGSLQSADALPNSGDSAGGGSVPFDSDDIPF